MPKSTEYQAKIPNPQGFIAYDRDEDAVWRDLMARQMPEVQRYMSRPYLDGLAKLDLPIDRVPQCLDLSSRLAPLTGWRVEPVPALIPFGTFFAMLADRAFPAASFIRKRKHFDYIEEPDIFHEIFGHAPLLTDPRFAAFSQAIGKAGLRAAKEDYAWLIRLYWFSVEFGLTREDGVIKGLGSGLASSVSELAWAVTSHDPERRALTSSTSCARPTGSTSFSRSISSSTIWSSFSKPPSVTFWPMWPRPGAWAFSPRNTPQRWHDDRGFDLRSDQQGLRALPG